MFTISFIIRFMPLSKRDGDRGGNCIPGTVVDTGIVVKPEFDFCKFVFIYIVCNIYHWRVDKLLMPYVLFYIVLQSHAIPQGTGRPTHYRVLVDDNKFKADYIQSLTNKLCYLNARLVIYDLISMFLYLY